MNKTFTRYFFSFAIILVCAVSNSFAQTITIGTVDAGPYGQGSTVAILFHINDAAGCIGQTNTFSLYMSNATGTFTSTTPVATISGFYATFFNYTLPANITAGTGYKFMVKANSPAISSLASNSFTVRAATGAVAVATSTAISSSYLNVFGECNGTAKTFYFTNSSAGGLTVTASFFNEITQAAEGPANQNITSVAYPFAANAANYTVMVKAVAAGGIVGTQAYQLINNPLNTSLGTQGAQAGCVSGSSGTALTFTVDIASANGIQNDYPGNLYTFGWGDGTSTVYTFCQLKTNSGNVSHVYTQTSCGNTVNGHANSFAVNSQVSNIYCGVTAGQTGYAKVFATPTNLFTSPTAVCTGSTVTFANKSNPGPDPNATVSSCTNNPNALYAWLIDGVLVQQNYTLTHSLVYTFTTHGSHTVTLRAQTSNGSCAAADYSVNICVQDPPKPSFTLPVSPVCISAGPISPVNTSVVDENCNLGTQYAWTITPATFTYTGGTSATSPMPQVTFSAPGAYTFQLSITTSSCGQSIAPAQTLVVNGPPVTTLSPNATICGAGQTLSFNTTAGLTKTTLTGTTQALPATYTWAVAGGSYSYANGTTANSKYPQITFNDYATYTVSVTQVNNCGSASATQQITFQQAPLVSTSGSDEQICQGAAANLVATITPATATGYQWLGGNGTFTPNRTSLNATYMPSAGEIAAGIVNLTFQATTTLAAPCNNITSTVAVTIIPTDVVTSTAVSTICSGDQLNYTITASNTGSTFTWTATVTSGSATGYTATGSGKTIADIISNLAPATTAVVTYTITPTSNGCTGTPFTYAVTIPAVPVITLTKPNAAICSGQPANINLSANLTGTTYTWAAAAPTGVSGFNNATTATTNATIADILVNTTTTTQTVTYTVTPYNSNGCAGSPGTITIDVYPQPVTANAGNNASLCDISAYTLAANSPGAGTGKWTVISGSGIAFADDTSPTSIITGLQPATIYVLQWAISTAPTCQSTSQVTITTNTPTIAGTTAAGSNTTVCTGNNTDQINLTGQTGSVLRWESSTDNGATWQSIADTTTSLTYLNLTQTTSYHAIVQNGACNIATSGQTIITVNQQTPVAYAGPDQNLCNVTTAALTATDPGIFAGTWHQTAGPAVTFTDSTKFKTGINGLIGGNTYSFIWTIKGLSPCVNTQSSVTVTDNAASVGGATATTDPVVVCLGANSGQINLTGQTGTITGWQLSVDNGNTWQPVADTLATLSFSNLLQTTIYRAIVQNDICGAAISGTTIITVNPTTPVAYAGPDQTLCNAATATLSATDPGSFAGVWHQTSGPAVIFTDSTRFQTTISGLTGANTYSFIWTIKGLSPCVSTQSTVSITNNADVIASFKSGQKTGCGDLSVQFTNTSNNQPSAKFIWNFGDGTTSAALSPQHTFAQRTDGKDSTYVITLSVLDNCFQRAPVTDTILVRPAKPVALITPNQINSCGVFSLDVQNLSPGNNLTYDFYLYNAGTLVQVLHKVNNDKTDAVFDPITPLKKTTYTLYMTATGYCGATTTTTSYPVTVSPVAINALVSVQNTNATNCAPLNVTFLNLSSAGDTFHYNIYDAGNNIIAQPIGGTDPLPYTFTTPGTYHVTITASNNCGTIESPSSGFITVYAIPTPAFTADVTTACKDLTVQFTNQTISNDPNTPVTSLAYDWDFGDGSTHSFSPNPSAHHYHFTNSPYTVTLTTTNTTSGCVNTFVKKDYITISAPPFTAFAANPDSVIAIPDYHFNFVDETKGSPISWKWTFSDGQTSTNRNPQITFADTGTYKATLTTTNSLGCDSTISHIVRITGVPGQLFLPNAFIPTSTTADLRLFMAKGSGIKQWHLQIFNTFGQLVWETIKLDGKGAPVEGWDGTYRGAPAQQGVYIWQANATFINGNEWKGNSYNNSLPKRTGSLNLIR